mmetsp:Transcript_40459/g.114500  ORF Transcript_40459/g.114500 Transcript_40459/m.114500 type:complete len:280 (+) Transcript_40459:686-1525(+)
MARVGPTFPGDAARPRRFAGADGAPAREVFHCREGPDEEGVLPRGRGPGTPGPADALPLDVRRRARFRGPWCRTAASTLHCRRPGAGDGDVALLAAEALQRGGGDAHREPRGQRPGQVRAAQDTFAAAFPGARGQHRPGVRVDPAGWTDFPGRHAPGVADREQSGLFLPAAHPGTGDPHKCAAAIRQFFRNRCALHKGQTGATGTAATAARAAVSPAAAGCRRRLVVDADRAGRADWPAAAHHGAAGHAGRQLAQPGRHSQLTSSAGRVRRRARQDRQG